MKTSSRLDTALQKLYVAFNNGHLQPECCKQCAVGTILDGTDSWKHLSDDHGSLTLNYVGRVNETLGRRFNGYRPSELLLIEQTFLKACGFAVPLHHTDHKPSSIDNPDDLFKGLCAVIKVLCELDHAPDLISFEKLNSYLNQKSEHGFVSESIS